MLWKKKTLRTQTWNKKLWHTDLPIRVNMVVSTCVRQCLRILKINLLLLFIYFWIKYSSKRIFCWKAFRRILKHTPFPNDQSLNAEHIFYRNANSSKLTSGKNESHTTLNTLVLFDFKLISNEVSHYVWKKIIAYVNNEYKIFGIVVLRK